MCNANPPDSPWARPNHPAGEQPFILPDPLPDPPRQDRRSTPPSPSTPRKRPLDAAEGELPPKKRVKGDMAPASILSSPSKKRRLEEDGLLILEDPTENIDADVTDEGFPQLITIDD